MAIDTSFQHPPSATAQERMLHRVTITKGSSPFYADEDRSAPVDRSQIVSCTCCTPSRRFLSDAFLERHQKDHARPKQAKTTAVQLAAEAERVAETIVARVAGGELRPGDAINQTGLANELGLPRTRVEAAVAQLVESGRLGYSGDGSARRALVV